MTKKDYVLIADIILLTYRDTKNLDTLTCLADNTARALRIENPRFDTDKFYKYLDINGFPIKAV
jgi:hypothetical protein